MKVEERLLKYIAIKTPCDENSDTVPTSQCQFDLARILADELKELGLDKVVLDDKCFVYGILAATPGYENKKKLGLIAHMDTVPEFCEAEIHPVCTPDYDGCDLVLGDSGRVLTTKDFPHLKGLKGRTLITSDGNTILGVDDKAGIAEIMQLLEILITEKIPHGQISVAFTPDEECGSGAAHFDFDTFDAEVAYTLDGDGEGEIQYQNFNACEAKFEINGKNVHPGSAKDVMINAVLIAADINNMLPRFEIPRHTEQLAEIIRQSIPMKFQKMSGHPAKRTFQAIRIECNRELEVLRDSLDDMIDILNPGGRICIITFHSLEDRIVKGIFKKNENPCTCPSTFPVCVCGKVSKGKVITKKPILPSEEEMEVNSRSKSAKLRIFERV